MIEPKSIEEIQNFKGKYPRQLWYLFLIEMWERFTFYGMRALLVLYISHLMLSGDYHKADDALIAKNIESYEKEHKGEKITEAHPQFYILTSEQKYADKAEAASSKRYGIINAFIYMMAFLGGLFADKIFGFRRSIFWGGILMALGTFIMAIPGSFSFYIGVSLLIVGTGFFKPNISTMVGMLYKEGDPRRDAGFSLFYSGINIGAFLSGLTIAYIGTAYSWSLGFALAGICMLLGLSLFLFTQKSLGPIGLPPKPELLKAKWNGIPKGWLYHFGSLLFIPLFFTLIYIPLEFNMTGVFGTQKSVYFEKNEDKGILNAILFKDSIAIANANVSLVDEKGAIIRKTQTDEKGSFRFNEISLNEVHSLKVDTSFHANKITYLSEKNTEKELGIIDGEFPIIKPYIVQFVDIIFLVAALIAILYLVIEIRKCDRDEGRKLLAAVILIFFSVIFWSFFEQGGGSLNYFANGNVQSHGLNMTSVNNSVNALWVILFAPLVGLLWLALNKRSKEPNTVIKFGLGFIFLGLGFFIFFASKFSANAAGYTPLMTFCFAYLVITIGELCLSPIGLSMITKLSPKRLFGVMMGTWFLASAYGQYGAGLIGAALAQDDSGKNLTNLEKLEQYTNGYEMISYISIGSGLFLILISPFIRKLMQEVK